MKGELRVRLSTAQGHTRVIESYAHAPLHYLPPAAGEPPLLTLINSSGGVLGGDILETSIDLEAGARLALRTQAATKLYRSDRGAAVSSMRFGLATGAILDYFPDEIIPFAGSDYAQYTEVDLQPGSILMMSEIVTAGRTARGEHLAFARLLLDVRCKVAGALHVWDRADLRPATQRLAGPAILGNATVWATLYVFTTQDLPSVIVDSVHTALDTVEGGQGAASFAPLGLIGRVLGTSLDAVHAALAAARAVLWQHLLPAGTGS